MTSRFLTCCLMAVALHCLSFDRALAAPVEAPPLPPEAAVQPISLGSDGSESIALGSIVFRINPVSYVRTVDAPGVSGSGSSSSVIRGAPTFEFVTGYESVTIANASALDLHINAIDVINRSGNFSSSITVNVASKSGFTPITRTVTGATDLRIDASGGGNVVLNARVANPYGSSLIRSGDGDIVSADDTARLDSDSVTLEAGGGAVLPRPAFWQTDLIERLAETLQNWYVSHLEAFDRPMTEFLLRHEPGAAAGRQRGGPSEG